MSVINQMLKDLEQRGIDGNANAIQPSNVALSYSARKVAIVTGLSVFVVCIISFYVWQLVSENKALKVEKITYQANTQLGSPVDTQASPQLSSQLSKPISQPISSGITLTPPSKTANIAPLQQQVEDTALHLNTDKNNIAKAASNVTVYPQEKEQINKAQLITPKPLEQNSSSRVTPAKKAAVIADISSSSAATSSHSHDVMNKAPAAKVKTETKVKTKKNTMSVSRRQLSADELAEQKLTLVEKALAAQQIAKAEKLLEEVIILRPNDSQTRKKLAALWFGRQAYQDATNILSQGIALNGKDSSLRVMKARIHLQQGQVMAALNTLKPLDQLADESYQIMLANTAQQAQQNHLAVNAYKVLIMMNPDMGRWHLAIAVLYDKNSQFSLASAAYKSALTKNDLSLASVNFVKQRIQVIGQ